MAGPSASVVLPSSLGDDDIASVIRQMSDATSVDIQSTSTDFWISDGRAIGVDYCGEGRPFIMTLGEQFDVDEIDALATILPWTPQDQIGLAAMCNSDVDHALLAHLCLHLSEKFSGVTDLGGDLRTFTSDAGILSNAGDCAVEYVSALGQTCVSHFLLPAGLRRWCQHPDFRMVK